MFYDEKIPIVLAMDASPMGIGAVVSHVTKTNDCFQKVSKNIPKSIKKHLLKFGE